MSIIDRLLSPTPSFFQKLRNIGLILAAVSAAIVASPVALPAIVTTVAGYIAVAGSVLGAVSQITIPTDTE